MKKSSKLLELYTTSINKLIEGLPKFVVFFSIIILIWLSSPLILSLGKGIFVDNIEVTRIINLVLLAYTLMFILLSFKEITQVADAIAGLIVYYSSPVSEESEKIKERLRRMQTSFRQISYIIVFSILYSISKEFLTYVSPLLATFLGIIIVLWLLGTLYILAMTIASEFEEKAKHMRKEISRILRRKKL